MGLNFAGNSASQYLESAFSTITGPPLTMSCWFYPNSNNLIRVLMSLSVPTLNNRYYIGCGNPATQLIAGQAPGSSAISSTSITAGVWQHACGRFNTTASRDIFHNGGSMGSNTTSGSPGSPTRFNVGVSSISNTRTGFWEGKIAEAGVWNVALTDDEIAALGKGVCPLLIRPDALVIYAPIIGKANPEIDLSSALSLAYSASAPTVDIHPRIMYPRGLYIGGTTTSQNILPSAISSAEAFGTAAIKQKIECSGIASAEAFGTTKINQQVVCSGIASAEAFGTAAVNQSVQCNGIPSGEVFGTPFLSYGQDLLLTGISSAEEFGTTKVNQSVQCNGIPSAEAFGNASLILRQDILLTGIPSAEAVGTPNLGAVVACEGIGSGEAFGTCELKQKVVCSGITSGEAFGTTKINQNIIANGIASAGAFGTLAVHQTIQLEGIGTGEAFGEPSLALKIVCSGIASGEAFGNIQGLHRRITCTSFKGWQPITRYPLVTTGA